MTGAERLFIQKHALRVAEDLIGTARNINEVTHAAERNDIDFCRELDEHAFVCEVCGWWCAAEEMRSDMICEECDVPEGGC